MCDDGFTTAQVGQGAAIGRFHGQCEQRLIYVVFTARLLSFYT
jgi:hypothetical protein